MLEITEVPHHRAVDEDRFYCEKAKNGSRALLALLRKHHGEIIQQEEPEPEPQPAPEPVEINEPEPVDPIKVWVERQKSIPLPKRQWFSVEKDIGPVTPRAIRIEDIIKATAKHYRVSSNDILSVRRTGPVVRARQVAMYLGKQLTRRSLPEVGRRMYRDHTTVLYAVCKIERLRWADPQLENDLRTIAAAVGGSLV